MRVLPVLGVGSIAVAAALPQSARDCVPSYAAAALPSVLPQLAGNWDLILHRLQRGRARLSLRLIATDSTDQTSRSIIDGRIRRDTSFIYFGTLVGDGRGVGLGRLREESLDLDQPSVRIVTSKYIPGGVLISVGAEQNNRKVIRFDGYNLFIQLQSASDSLLLGTWQAGVHVASQVDSGRCCARRIH